MRSEVRFCGEVLVLGCRVAVDWFWVRGSGLSLK